MYNITNTVPISKYVIYSPLSLFSNLASKEIKVK
jgi:hypothetical protein